MQRNLELQLQLHSEQNSVTQDYTTEPKSEPLQKPPSKPSANIEMWTGAFNTSLLTTRASALTDGSSELSALMKTKEFECLLLAAQQLAAKECISAEEATERLISVFRKIDRSWKQIVMSRGLKSLTDSN